MSRKHRKQMHPEELHLIREAIDGLQISTIWHFDKHVFDRIFQKKLSAEDILNCVKYGEVIEIHQKVRGDIRVLLRQSLKKGDSICSVVSLKTEKVITAYHNRNNDYHSTIDWSEYRWTENLIPVLKGFIHQRLQKG